MRAADPCGSEQVPDHDPHRLDPDAEDLVAHRAHDPQQHRGRERHGDRGQSRVAEPARWPDRAARDEVDDGQDGHVGHAAAEQLADGQVRGPVGGRRNRSDDLRQRGGAGEQEHAHEEPTEAGPDRDGVPVASEHDSGRDHRRRRKPEDDGQLPEIECIQHPTLILRDDLNARQGRLDPPERPKRPFVPADRAAGPWSAQRWAGAMAVRR